MKTKVALHIMGHAFVTVASLKESATATSINICVNLAASTTMQNYMNYKIPGSFEVFNQKSNILLFSTPFGTDIATSPHAA